MTPPLPKISVVVCTHNGSRTIRNCLEGCTRLRYPDSLMSANDRCAVSGSRLNPRARPVYVNGTPIGFC